ncbi:phage major capsid protein [Nocardia brasiliensis]|uniref:Phage major capsid protein n=1 Tax=Nocardia brasiliensis TaxID=37326 RepID=A0A6G9Y123_NOCBR|nr:phage major capsid protein [Nocardia brasiliensis]QIS06763.1 phage major capsid protein [Nocardia brasiliensis]
MANTATLKARGNQLREDFKTITENTELTGAQRTEKLKSLEADVKTYETDLANSELASQLSAKLGRGEAGSGDTPDPAPTMTQRTLAALIMRHPDFVDASAAVDPDAKRAFSKAFEIDLKDASVAQNQMGESIMGTVGPTPLGQNPFFPTGAAAAILQPTWLGGIVEQRFYALTIADLIPGSAISTNNLSYVVESAFTNNADEVPEAGQYPYSSTKLDRVYEQLGKIANAEKLTDETIADSAMFQNFAQGRLVLGVQRKEEAALLAGKGNGGVNGLLNRSTGFTKPQTIAPVTNVSFPPTGVPGAATVPSVLPSLTYGRKVVGAAAGAYPTAVAIAEAVFQAMTDIWLNAHVAPTAVVMNPLDWQVIRLAKDSAGQYFGGSFFGTNYGNGAGTGEGLWNKPVVVTPAIPPGTVLVGTFTRDVLEAFRRQGISVEMSNSNGNDFDHGLVTVRAQMRTGLAVYRPSGFELIQLANGS